MVPMMRCLAFLLFLALLAAPVAAETAPSSFSLRFGMGLTRVWDDQLSDTLRSVSQQPVDQASLIPMSWALSYNFGGLETEIASTRTTNTLFGPQSGPNRTRLIVDSATLTFGSRWILSANLFFTAGLGVEVSELLLQTYNAGSESLSQALGQSGNLSLVSRWNWSPAATARMGWRFLTLPKSTYGYTLGVGATVSGFFLPVRWKIADDVSVSGIGRPWGPSIRPEVWIGIE